LLLVGVADHVEFSMTHRFLVIVFVAKLPFPLTLGFKPMMQRGISTPDMDTRWVSSLSWYFLNFFGLNGVYQLLLGNEGKCQRRSCSVIHLLYFQTLGWIYNR